jgi:hypothetical protein
MGQFVRDNIRDELASQQISFSAAPSEEEVAAIPGLVDYAGEDLTTGNQARVYSDLIGLHMANAAEGAGYPDATYATLGGIQRQLRTAVAEANESGDEDAIAEAQAQLASVDGLRNTMLTGSTLRGNLLSAYGWDNVATGITVGGVVFLVLSLLFFVLLFYEYRRGHLPIPEAEAQFTGSSSAVPAIGD